MRNAKLTSWLVILGWGLSLGGCCGLFSKSRDTEPTVQTAPETGEVLPAKWVRIEAGSFSMGSPESEPDHQDDESAHEVVLTHDFEMQKTEVTQAQFESLMRYNPSQYPGSKQGCPTCPVEGLSWAEAAAFVNALSKDAGLDQCYECEGSGHDVACGAKPEYLVPYECPGYRLPTEAEWEYAARAGTKEATYNGDPGDSPRSCDPDPVLDPIAWHCGNSEKRPHEVATKKANDWGLDDMLGNVWEWCHDGYDENYPAGPVTDPCVTPQFSHRVARGGSWSKDDASVRAAERFMFDMYSAYIRLGFRPVRTLL